jgi:hypothetical protein
MFESSIFRPKRREYTWSTEKESFIEPHIQEPTLTLTMNVFDIIPKKYCLTIWKDKRPLFPRSFLPPHVQMFRSGCFTPFPVLSLSLLIFLLLNLLLFFFFFFFYCCFFFFPCSNFFFERLRHFIVCIVVGDVLFIANSMSYRHIVMLFCKSIHMNILFR